MSEEPLGENEEPHDHDHDVDKVAGHFFEQEVAVDEEGEALDADVDDMLEQSISDKIRFVFGAADQEILVRMDVLAQADFAETFAPAIAVMNRFYQSLWVPLLNDHGVFQGQYEMDPATGRPVERWSQLDGQTIEQCIMDLARIKLVTARKVAKLRNEAVFAKMAADDVKDEVVPTVKGGTVLDKTAKANRRSRQDRYHAYFCYVLWSQADTFHREIIDFMFRLKDVRNWRIQAQPR